MPPRAHTLHASCKAIGLCIAMQHSSPTKLRILMCCQDGFLRSQLLITQAM